MPRSKRDAMDFAVAGHGHFQPVGRGVDAGDADAVQAAGDFVRAAVELAARVQFGQREFHAGHAVLLVDIYGNAASVVLHGDAAIGVQDHIDAGRRSPPSLRRWRCR